MMKIEDNENNPKICLKNCKNTKTIDGEKKVQCICGSTRLKASICVKGEGSGYWLMLKCKACNNWLYYNGA